MELSDVLRRLKIAAIAFIGVLLLGILGFGIISDGRWFDAFYMTAITISTIGFHEVIDLHESHIGRVFTVFIAFSGIGVLTYLLSNLSALFIEGDIRKTFSKKTMMKNIQKMEDHYIICGCGRVGRNIAQEFTLTRRPFIMTDLIEKPVEGFLKEFPDSFFITGDSTDEKFLLSLGVEKAKGVFATAADDNTNLVICITARQLNPQARIIARIRDTSHIPKMKRAGADEVISPNYIGGQRMASVMVRPEVTSFLDDMTNMSEGNLRMEEVSIPLNYQNKKVEDLPLESCPQTLLLAVKQGTNWIYNPKNNLVLNTGDLLIVMTTPEDRIKLLKKLE